MSQPQAQFSSAFALKEPLLQQSAPTSSPDAPISAASSFWTNIRRNNCFFTTVQPPTPYKRNLTRAAASIMRGLSFDATELYAVVFCLSIGLPTICSFAAVQAASANYPALTSYVAEQAVVSALTVSVLLLAFSRFETCGNVDTISAVLLGRMAKTTVQEVLERSGGRAGATTVIGHVLLLNVLANVLFSAAMFGLGRRRVAVLLRFLPYSVLAGFIGGTGLITVQSGLQLALGCPLRDIAVALYDRIVFLRFTEFSEKEDQIQRQTTSSSSTTRTGGTAADESDRGNTTDMRQILALFLITCVYVGASLFLKQRHRLGGIFMFVVFVALCEALRASGTGLPPENWYLSVGAGGGDGSHEPRGDLSPSGNNGAPTSARTSDEEPGSSHVSPSFNWYSFLYEHAFLANDFYPSALIFPQSLLSYVAVMCLNWMLNIAACKRIVSTRPEWSWKSSVYPLFLSDFASTDEDDKVQLHRLQQHQLHAKRNILQDHHMAPSSPFPQDISSLHAAGERRLAGSSSPPGANPKPGHPVSPPPELPLPAEHVVIQPLWSQDTAESQKSVRHPGQVFPEGEAVLMRALSDTRQLSGLNDYRPPALAMNLAAAVPMRHGFGAAPAGVFAAPPPPAGTAAAVGPHPARSRSRSFSREVTLPGEQEDDAVAVATAFAADAETTTFQHGTPERGRKQLRSQQSKYFSAAGYHSRWELLQAGERSPMSGGVVGSRAMITTPATEATPSPSRGVGPTTAYQTEVERRLLSREGGRERPEADRTPVPGVFSVSQALGTQATSVDDEDADARGAAAALPIDEDLETSQLGFINLVSALLLSNLSVCNSMQIAVPMQELLRKKAEEELKGQHTEAAPPPSSTATKLQAPAKTNLLRLWPAYCILMYAVAYLLSPAFFVKFLPKFVLGGLVILVGIGLVIDSLWESRERIARTEWFALLTTAAFICYDIAVGVPLGIAVSLVLFVSEYASMTGVAGEATLETARSCVDYSEAEVRVLLENPLRVQVMWLHGYLFFGSATAVVERVRTKLQEATRAAKALQGGGPRRGSCGQQVPVVPGTVIVDFSSVPAMDANGVFAVAELAREPGVNLILTGLVRRLRNALQAADAGHNFLVFEKDLDHALEKCETLILLNAARTSRRRWMMNKRGGAAGGAVGRRFPAQHPRDRIRQSTVDALLAEDFSRAESLRKNPTAATQYQDHDEQNQDTLLGSRDSRTEVGSTPRGDDVEQQEQWEKEMSHRIRGKDDIEILARRGPPHHRRSRERRHSGNSNATADSFIRSHGARSGSVTKTASYVWEGLLREDFFLYGDSVDGNRISELLAKHSALRVYDAEESVYLAGDPATELRFLLEGAVEIFDDVRQVLPLDDDGAGGRGRGAGANQQHANTLSDLRGLSPAGDAGGSCISLDLEQQKSATMAATGTSPAPRAARGPLRAAGQERRADVIGGGPANAGTTTSPQRLLLPRYHLNKEKGDLFAFEQHPRRIRVARRGALIGVEEYLAYACLCCHTPLPRMAMMSAAAAALDVDDGEAVGGTYSARSSFATAAQQEHAHHRGEGAYSWHTNSAYVPATRKAVFLVIDFQSLLWLERTELQLSAVLRNWLIRSQLVLCGAASYAALQHILTPFSAANHGYEGDLDTVILNPKTVQPLADDDEV